MVLVPQQHVWHSDNKGHWIEIKLTEEEKKTKESKCMKETIAENYDRKKRERW